jgi:hypothetical protein
MKPVYSVVLVTAATGHRSQFSDVRPCHHMPSIAAHSVEFCRHSLQAFRVKFLAQYIYIYIYMHTNGIRTFCSTRICICTLIMAELLAFSRA